MRKSGLELFTFSFIHLLLHDLRLLYVESHVLKVNMQQEKHRITTKLNEFQPKGNLGYPLWDVLWTSKQRIQWKQNTFLQSHM